MLTVAAKFLLVLMSLPMSPISNGIPEKVVQTQLVKSAEENLVKEACRIWWNLPEPVSTSAKGLAKWAKQQLPAVSKALTKASQAKKLNKKWASFQLDMVGFWGALSLGQEAKYSQVMFTSTAVQKSLRNLGVICAYRH
jgi:hypothetical protein